MESIRRQVSRARWRLNCQCFLRIVPWTLLATLCVAAGALAVPKIWVVPVDEVWWAWSWVGGALGAGLVAALIATWIARRNTLDAAIEIDRRFQLRERVSSAWMLPATESDTDAGRALLADAERRVTGIEICDAFRVRLPRTVLLPFLPVLLGALIVLLPAATRQRVQASTGDEQARQQIQRSAQELSRKLAQRGKQAEQAGLKDAEALFKQLREGVDELSRRDDVDRKRALIKLNDLAKEIEKRRTALGNPAELQRQLERLKGFERGPAEKLAEALQQGDPEQALQQLNKLREQLQAGKLTEQQQQQLAKQLQDIQRKMQEAADAHRQAKQELQRQIQQKLNEGDLEAAGKLQRQLEELQSRDKALDQLEQMADRLGKAGESLQQDDPNKADSELNELAKELEELQSDLEKTEQLDELMDEIASAKNAMKCDECSGEGCEQCQGSPSLGDLEGRPNDGLGGGAGFGERPESATKTGAFESRVRAKPKAGEAVRIGDAPGPNRAGLSQQQLKEQIETALREAAEPLSEQRLPRAQQDHVRQYYERRRKGE